MNTHHSRYLIMAMTSAVLSVSAANPRELQVDWLTVVNNNDLMPPLHVRNFNSYNQPSVNAEGLVVFRARSRGGPPLGQPTHGIYTRDMADSDGEIIRILDRTTEVPYPNNLGSTFVETPAFPRIDLASSTIATRGNHQPVWRYMLEDGSETRTGTTGIYTNPFSDLISGASNLGHAPGFAFYAVPEFPSTRFEVFPGAPSVTDGHTLVFKGNYTVDGIGKTGVYYRDLEDEPAGGTMPVVMIANNTDTLIPGSHYPFGSTSPPSAVGRQAVFAGFDDENAPSLGGIYLAPLQYQPSLTELVSIGERIPGGTPHDRFKNLGEGVAFDGRFVGFWGTWGEEARTVRLYCAEEGNKDRIDYCNQRLVCMDTGEKIGDPNSICDDMTDPNFGSRCYQEKQVPVNQGIFVHDSKTGATSAVARTGLMFDEFLFWNYSGKTPCTGGGHSEEGAEDEGEPARWRSSAFVAVSPRSGATFNATFKARSDVSTDVGTISPVVGIYLKSGPGKSRIQTLLDTTMDGQILDPEAPVGSTITELGLEREGLRGDWLSINASMGIEGGTEDEGMAGIYITRLP